VITISVTTSDPITLNGVLLDGAGTGQYGIKITSGQSVQILNSAVRHFSVGINIAPSSANGNATLSRITANKQCDWRRRQWR
jgi:hypothetical protein